MDAAIRRAFGGGASRGGSWSIPSLAGKPVPSGTSSAAASRCSRPRCCCPRTSNGESGWSPSFRATCSSASTPRNSSTPSGGHPGSAASSPRREAPPPASMMLSSSFCASVRTSDGVIVARADLTVGSQVEVSRGPFDGLMGIITRPPDAKGRVRVLMRLLNRDVGEGGRARPLAARCLGRLNSGRQRGCAHRIGEGRAMSRDRCRSA